MLTLDKLIPAGRGLAGVLLNARHGRTRLGRAAEEPLRRHRLAGAAALSVFLPRGTVLRGGDVLVAEDGSLVRAGARSRCCGHALPAARQPSTCCAPITSATAMHYSWAGPTTCSSARPRAGGMLDAIT